MSERERIEAIEKEMANLKNEIELLKTQITWVQVPMTQPPNIDPKFGYDPFKDHPKTWPTNTMIDNSRSFTLVMDKYPEMAYNPYDKH